MLTLDAGDSGEHPKQFSTPQPFSHRTVFRIRPPPVTQAIETVEKVPLQKLIFEKWDRNIEKRLVFYVSNNNLAIYEPVVGVFCEDFSNKGFFDSLIGLFLAEQGRKNEKKSNNNLCHPSYLVCANG